MLLSLVSWDGNTFSTNYDAYILDGLPLLTPASGVYVEKADVVPELVGVKLSSPTISIIVKYKTALSDQHNREREIKRWFQTTQVRKSTEKKLLAQDTADSNRQWSIMARPISVVPQDDSAIIVLATTEAFWHLETERTDSWSITATGQTKNITVVGDHVKPVFEITPGAAKTGTYQYFLFVEVIPPATLTLGRYNLDIAKGLNTGALVSGGKCQSNGNDFRLLSGNVEIARWLGNFGNPVSNQINQVGGITAAATTINIDTSVGGGLPAFGEGTIDTEQISWTGNSGTQLTGVTRGINGTTAATHADNAVIYNNTKVWTALEWKPKMAVTLGASIASTGSITEISVKNLAADKTMLAKFPGSGILKIGSERFTYSAIDNAKLKFTGVERQAKQSSMAAHSVNDTITLIPYDLWFMYGNSTIDAPEQDDTYKPMFNLDESTNTSWKYDEFTDDTLARGAEWKTTVASSLPMKTAAIYYATEEAEKVDPSTDLGLTVPVGYIGNVPRAETGILFADVFCAAGFTHIATLSGKKYRHDVYWGNVFLRKSKNGRDYFTQYTVTKPTAPKTWETWSLSAQALGGTYPYLRFHMGAAVPAKVGNKVSAELNSILLTVNSANIPTVTLASEDSAYYMDATITITTTTEQESLTISGVMKQNETITVDCQNRTAKHQDGTYWAVKLSTERPEWLVAENGTQTLQYDEAGISDVGITIRMVDRAAL